MSRRLQRERDRSALDKMGTGGRTSYTSGSAPARSSWMGGNTGVLSSGKKRTATLKRSGTPMTRYPTYGMPGTTPHNDPARKPRTVEEFKALRSGRVPEKTTPTLTSEFQGAQDEAKTANEKRYGEILGVYGDIEKMYGPEGSYGAGAMAQYDREKFKSIENSKQDLVSRGLGGSTLETGLGKQYEEEVGNPFRLQLADMKMRGLDRAMTGKAGVMERREDTYPEMSLYLKLMQQLGLTA